MPRATVHDFSEPLPLPAAAAPLSHALVEAAPRVGLLLGMASGRTVLVQCSGLRRVGLVEVTGPQTVWAELRTGLSDAALLVTDSPSAIALADVFLGGPGQPDQRPVTALELDLLVKQVVPALRPLAEALRDHGVVAMDARAATLDPLPTGYGEVVAIPLSLRLPSGAEATLTVCLPAKSLLPNDSGPALAEPSAAAAGSLGDVQVEVAVRLLPSVVSAADVDGLQPGDVVQLHADAVRTLVGLVPGDQHVFTAELGRRDTRRAVLVSTVESGAL